MNGTNGFTTNSYVSMGLLVTLIGATWLICTKLNDIVSANLLMGFRITEMEKRQSRPDPWTGTDMLRWTVEFGQLNPTLKISEPKHFRDQ